VAVLADTLPVAGAVVVVVVVVVACVVADALVLVDEPQPAMAIAAMASREASGVAWRLIVTSQSVCWTNVSALAEDGL
jgi:hypothetical protein